jgi:hypothetical protein
MHASATLPLIEALNFDIHSKPTYKAISRRRPSLRQLESAVNRAYEDGGLTSETLYAVIDFVSRKYNDQVAATVASHLTSGVQTYEPRRFLRFSQYVTYLAGQALSKRSVTALVIDECYLERHKNPKALWDAILLHVRQTRKGARYIDQLEYSEEQQDIVSTFIEQHRLWWKDAPVTPVDQKMVQGRGNAHLAILTAVTVCRALDIYRGDNPVAGYDQQRVPLSSYVSVVAKSLHNREKDRMYATIDGERVHKGSVVKAVGDDAYLDHKHYRGQDCTGASETPLIDSSDDDESDYKVKRKGKSRPQRGLYNGRVERDKLKGFAYEEFKTTLPIRLHTVVTRCEWLRDVRPQDEEVLQDAIGRAHEWGAQPRPANPAKQAVIWRKRPGYMALSELRQLLPAPPVRATSIENTYNGLADPMPFDEHVEGADEEYVAEDLKWVWYQGKSVELIRILASGKQAWIRPRGKEERILVEVSAVKQ